jgi:acetyl esterase
MPTVTAQGERVSEVHYTSVPTRNSELPVRIYVPHDKTSPGTMLYFHGGGWMVGTLETFDAACRALANRCGMPVVSVDYRLAPEHQYPAAVQDCLDVATWVGSGMAGPLLAAAPLVLAGESAGANLAAVLALRARDLANVHVAAQVLAYPITDATMNSASYREFGAGYYLTAADMEWYWRMYLGDRYGGVDHGFSPLHAPDLAGLPPAFVATAEYDPLRDEGEEYAARLARAGTPVRLYRADGMIHGFLRLTAICADAAAGTFDAISEFVRLALCAEQVKNR